MLKLAAAVAACLAAAPALAADVVVTLEGVKAKGGTLVISLYDEKTFLSESPFRTAEVKGGAPTVTFRGVPPGDYAVAAFHDADENLKMTMGADGRMGEGTALSNAEAMRGPPSFDVNKVTVPASGYRTTLRMSYPEDRSGW